MSTPSICDPQYSVQVHKITHRYNQKPVLQEVSFVVPHGILFGLLGPNGSGKTTLFRILSTLLHPSKGYACIEGLHTVKQAEEVRKQLGVIFQQPALDGDLTVLENLRFHGALYGLHGTPLHQRLQEVLQQFQLTERAHDRVSTLSGGLQRRVDLARGLLHRPKVLLLDEPTTGLDPLARRTFWDLLMRLRKTEGITMLVATHLMEEAESCDQLVILHQGKVVASGTPETLKAQLGGETLWIETPYPETLAQKLQTMFNVPVRIIGSRVQISHPEAHRLLSTIYEHFEDLISSAMIRKPTLEDVFMVLTGNIPVEMVSEEK